MRLIFFFFTILLSSEVFSLACPAGVTPPTGSWLGYTSNNPPCTRDVCWVDGISYMGVYHTQMNDEQKEQCAQQCGDSGTDNDWVPAGDTCSQYSCNSTDGCSPSTDTPPNSDTDGDGIPNFTCNSEGCTPGQSGGGSGGDGGNGDIGDGSEPIDFGENSPPPECNVLGDTDGDCIQDEFSCETNEDLPECQDPQDDYSACIGFGDGVCPDPGSDISEEPIADDTTTCADDGFGGCDCASTPSMRYCRDGYVAYGKGYALSCSGPGELQEPLTPCNDAFNENPSNEYQEKDNTDITAAIENSGNDIVDELGRVDASVRSQTQTIGNKMDTLDNSIRDMQGDLQDGLQAVVDELGDIDQGLSANIKVEIQDGSAPAIPSGTFTDQTSAIDTAKTEFQNKKEQVRNSFSSSFSITASSTGAMPCWTFNIPLGGGTKEVCLSEYETQLNILGSAILGMSLLISAMIMIRI